MEYEILTRNTLRRLQIDVEEHIKIGWTPQGGIGVDRGYTDTWYIQAIIKEAK